MARDDPELDFTQREVVLRADFDDLDDEGCLSVSVRFLLRGPRPPQEGEWVYLLDRHGDGCLAHVEALTGWRARVRPDWSTWASDARPPPATG